jgi:hypothetical protein
MRLSQQLVEHAFRMHASVYNEQRLWRIPYHLECWGRAKSAFDDHSFPDFEWLYGQLKRRWQAFRNARSTPWSARRTFDHLAGLGQRWRRSALRDMTDADVPGCWRILKSMTGLKPLTYGPSVVAISKFLHFWNPRLFVIVDDAVVWRWVFGHRWLRRLMSGTRRRIATLIDGTSETMSDGACDLLSYLAIVRWSAEVVESNAAIMECFARHVARHAEGTPIDVPLDSYDAAAMEWLLLGLVEIPPAGVGEAGAD